MAAGAGREGGTVVVTGASAGVGRAVAVAFARAGHPVGMIARGEEGLAGAVREIERFGGRALAVQADVAEAAAVLRAGRRFERELGPVAVWVNCAMVTIYAHVHEISPEEYRQVTDVTYLGQVHGTLAALDVMRRRDRGTIVSIGSALAYRSIPLQAPYCAAKAAVRGFIDSLRSELMHRGSGIRLTMVQLPAVNTPQFDWARNRLGRKLKPVPPIYQPEAIAAAVVEAARTAPREVWLGASAVKAIVGEMVAPGYADRYLARTGTTSETTRERDDPGRPDNLYVAGVGDPGAHGRFDRVAAPHVTSFDPAWLRAGVAAAGIGLLLGAAALGVRAGRASARPGRLPPRA